MDLQKIKDKIKSLLCCGTDTEKPEYITKKDYPEKRLSELAIDSAFIVAWHTAKGHPICQMITDLQNDMRNGFTSDKTFFTIDKEKVQPLEVKSSYRVTKLDDEGTRGLVQCNMFITADYTVG